MDNELMNSDFFKSLPEDVKKRLKNCKSEEEAMDILKENMIEIPAGELKNVSGGGSANGVTADEYGTTCPLCETFSWCTKTGNYREGKGFFEEEFLCGSCRQTFWM